MPRPREVELDRIRVEIDAHQRDLLILERGMTRTHRHVENLKSALAEAEEHDHLLFARWQMKVKRVNKLLDDMEASHES
jgi:predicted RNase H-like nuclease (RuvC/YqgF family)